MDSKTQAFAGVPKKLLSLIACLAFTISVFAQDVIVMKDGSTIQAKVEKVTSTEVEYKKSSNPDGPTYSVRIDDLISIDYQNGSRDIFSTLDTSSSSSNGAVNSGYVTDEKASIYSNDQKLLDLYYKKTPAEIEIKEGKKIRNISLFVGGALFLGGAFASFIGDPDGCNSITGSFHAKDLGYCLMGVGLVGGTTGFITGNNKIKKAQDRTIVSTIICKDIMLTENHVLNIGVDLINNNKQEIAFGLGIKYNF